MKVRGLLCVSVYSSLMCRTAEEVPWLLQRADLKKELYHIVLSVDILVQLYSGLAKCLFYLHIHLSVHIYVYMTSWNVHRGHGEELLEYWKQLDHSVNVMAAQYYRALRSIEEEQEGKRGTTLAAGWYY